MIYALIDGVGHIQVSDPASKAETTACGLELPFGHEWTRHLPDKMCGKCVPPKKAA